MGNVLAMTVRNVLAMTTKHIFHRGGEQDAVSTCQELLSTLVQGKHF